MGLKKDGSKTTEKQSSPVATLFELLLHHPFFIEKVHSIRSDYDIPESGWNSREEADAWREADGDRSFNFLQEVGGLLWHEFTIPDELHNAIVDLALDHIVLNGKGLSLEGEAELGIFLGMVLESRGLKPLYFYIEVTPYTTLKEIEENWYRITDTRKENEGERYNHGVAKTSKLGERLWELVQSGHKPKEAVDIINQESGEKVLSWSDSAYVHKLLSNYREALSSLRKIG